MSIKLHLESGKQGVSFSPLWSLCVGAGRAYEGLRASWQKQLALVRKTCGFRYLRFHGLFHDDMFVYKEINGKIIYNFQYVDELFDALLALEIKPFVEFGFCPGDLATTKGTVFWWKGNGSPPKDYAKWSELVETTVRHWIDRYGMEEVLSWYFEVWNEPNLSPFFKGTKSQYLKLYKASVLAIKKIDARLRVGGPATSNYVPDARFDGETENLACHETVVKSTNLDLLDWRPVWVEDFFKYCEREKLPVDFVSTHPYPTDWALDEHGQGRRSTRGVNATAQDLALLHKMVSASPYPKAEIHLTEWSSSSSPRDFTHDFLQAATYVAKVNIDSIGLADSLSYWTFTDIFEEGGAGDTIFHGGFGLINLQGVVKPTYHAYRFLHQLGDQLLVRTPSGAITRNSQSGKIRALIYHYPPEMPLTVPASFDAPDKAKETLALGRNEILEILLEGLAPQATVLVETLDASHGNAWKAWEAMGKPNHPTPAQEESLRQFAFNTKKEFLRADVKGTLAETREVSPWSLVFISEL